MWHQVYAVFGLGPRASFLFASLPILTMLLLLGAFRRPAWMAGLSGLLVTFLLAVFGYGMPVSPAIGAVTNGVAFGLFPISWIVFGAILLFRVTVATGQFEIIKDSIGRLTPDPRLQALLIAFAFGGFLEGAAGFGTPVAIASSMLIGLGFSSYSAAALCLLANTAPVAFGSLGIPIYTLAGTTGLPLQRLSGAVAAICTPIALLIPFYMLFALGGSSSLSGILVPTALVGGTFGLTQYVVATFLGPALTDILAGIAAMAVLVAYLKLRPTSTEGSSNHAAMLHRFARRSIAGEGIRTPVEATFHPHYTPRQLARAWTPYMLLVASVLLWSWAPFQRLLNRATVVFTWPFLHDVVHRMPPIVSVETPYHAIFTFNWLSAAGTACTLAAVLSALALRMSLSAFGRVVVTVLKQLALPTLTVTAVIGIAFLMNFCGATATLGLGFAATGVMFPFFSIVLGWIGVFLTGSDTSSNALFGNLQVVTASRLGLSSVLMAAANSSGGVMGKMISLQTIAIAAGATGLSALEQVRLFRFTLRHSAVLVAIAGTIALLYAYVLHVQ